METIVLNKTLENIREYKANFIPDGGVMHSDNLTKAAYIQAIGSEMQESILFSYLGTAAMSIREDGIYNYVEKVYDTSVTGDGEQTTEISQPYQFGIAPTERKGMLNPNGDSRYIEHPEISFAADEPWSVTTCLNYNGTDQVNASYVGMSTTGWMSLKNGVNFTSFRNSGGSIISFASYDDWVGKNTVLSYVADGLGSLSLYINGILISSESAVTDAAITTLMYENARTFTGTISAHIIRNIALSAEQVANEAAFLQSVYPEIPSKEIGEQTWATNNLDIVATCEGTVIANVTEAVNVETVTGGDFESGIIGYKTDAGGSISTWVLNTVSPISGVQDGRLSITTIGTYNSYPRLTNIAGARVEGEWRKLSFEYKVNSGICVMNYINTGGGASTVAETFSSSGTYEYFYKTNGIQNLGLYFAGNNLFDIQLDNISDEEVGWSGSQDLYTGLVAQGESVYDATAAAAMWCYYDNDSEIGSVYSKLYNWFSASLIQLDIDLYNTANPTEHWGYHIPSQAEFTTLQTTLGGSTVAGGKMKVEGEDYWSSPNTGATNSSGFSGLGSGRRADDGSFAYIKDRQYKWSIDAYSMFIYYSNTTALISDYTTLKRRGLSIRLIKD